uniref:Uncharacterized protein n=1 Tax=Mastacembelus armatus TaxID=205130 RepID=A0A3Q3ND65_9TELE
MVKQEEEGDKIGLCLQCLNVSRDTRHSVDSHLLHPSSLDLLHTLSHNEGNLGALSPSGYFRQPLQALIT